MTTNNTTPYVERTAVIDTRTGEVIDERTQRLARHYFQVQQAGYRNKQYKVAHHRLRPLLTREARDLLLAGFLVMLMGLLLWALAHTSNWPPTGGSV